ncbi:unnamed protein product, partial [marine sediment metagenome]
WTKNYAGGYLADKELTKLSFAGHGLLKIINDILWDQTDELGKYVTRGYPGTRADLVSDAKQYAMKSRRGHHDSTIRTLTELFSVGALVQDESGLIFSPFILKEVEKSQLKEKCGQKGGNPSLSSVDNQPQPAVDNLRVRVRDRDRERERDKNLHCRRSVPDAEAFELRDYQSEVLNKCVGRYPFEEHPKVGLLWKIGKEGGRQLVMYALAAVQDARNNNANPDRETVGDLEAYYFATVRNMFAEQGIETTINWNGGEK